MSSAVVVSVISCTVLSYEYSHGFVEMLRPHLSMHGGEGEAPRRGGQIRDNGPELQKIHDCLKALQKNPQNTTLLDIVASFI